MPRLIASVLLAGLGLVATTGCEPASPAHAQQPPQAGPTVGVEPLGLGLAAARDALAGVPGLARLAKAYVPFSDADADAALRRGGRSRGHVQPWAIQPSAFAWRPEQGTNLWVLSGRSGDRAVMALLYRRGGGRLEHAASLVVDEADASIAIGFADRYPKQLIWTTCYGCSGEGGTVRFGDDGRVEINYR